MDNNEVHHDPNIEKLYNELLKVKIKNLTPDESSESWEVIQLLYKQERRRRWKMSMIQFAAALSTTIVVGALIYKKKKKKKKNHFLGENI